MLSCKSNLVAEQSVKLFKLDQKDNCLIMKYNLFGNIRVRKQNKLIKKFVISIEPNLSIIIEKTF